MIFEDNISNVVTTNIQSDVKTSEKNLKMNSE